LSYTIPYNLYLDVNTPDLEEHCQIAGEMFKFKQKTQFQALRSVLCNLYIAKDRRVMARRKRESLGDNVTNPIRIGYLARNTTVDRLEKAGFIKVEKGDYLEGKETTIVATEKLKDWFKTTGWSKEKLTNRINGYVLVRGSRRQPVSFKHTDYSKWVEEKLKEYNRLINQQDISIEINGQRTSYDLSPITRPFIKHNIKGIEKLENKDFIFGGRIYGPWASASGNDRKTILINGEETIEIDRTASHINAMYQFVTGSPYQYGDPYHLEVDGLVIPRFIVKKYSSLMQGSKPGYQSTAMRVTRSFREDAEKKNAKQSDIDNYQIFLEWKKRYTPTKIIDSFLLKHSNISDYYRRGKAWGDAISCWESDIMFEVLVDLTDKGIPSLSVYDSVIVQKRHQDYVEKIINTMEYQDRKHLRDILLVNDKDGISKENQRKNL